MDRPESLTEAAYRHALDTWVSSSRQAVWLLDAAGRILAQSSIARGLAGDASAQDRAPDACSPPRQGASSPQSGECARFPECLAQTLELESSGRLSAALQDAQAGDPIRLDIELRNPGHVVRVLDTTVKWLAPANPRASATHGAPGEPSCASEPRWLVEALDVTERRRLELATRERAVRLSAMLESTLDAILEIDEHRNIRSFNAAAAAMFECSTQDALGSPLDRFITGSIPGLDEADPEQALSPAEPPGRQAEAGIVQGQKQNGEPFPLQVTITENRSGDATTYTAILRDIQRSSESATQLRAQRNFAQKLVDTAHVLVLILDPAGKILQSNGFIERISGFPPEELEAKDAFEHLLPAEERTRARKTFAAVLRGEKPGRHVHTLISRSGEKHVIEWWDTMLLDADGELLAVLCVGHDITSHRKTQRALRQSEHRAREMAEIASMSTLAAGLAHDIGTPMNIILGYAGMLEESLELERDRHRAHIICEQVERVRNLMHTLMNLAQPSPDSRAPVELAPLLTSVLDLLSDRVEKHSIRVLVSLQAGLSIMGSFERLERAFLNLLVNAVDAMPDGGELRVSLEPGSKPGGIQVEIADTGHGMTAAVRERIFEPFYTTKPLGDHPRSGNGLGLMVTRSVILDHGGSIEVESQPGRGTSFRIHFPGSANEATKSHA